ncbi:MGMT family protein [Nocardia caishijiensis]|uniref:Alkylated DNA nucleotide flippase Atl1 n=1 Tax=Nocardia caishijiensis TaxID=184756 RepID=A0ABQ6YJZ8_9NOCA|nr:MGMT family protein [Nocardia caishijiensis]KAF0845761.1 alkylated DNA nucleotide flippase Atl1 [Nocardia caishijiensis]
MSLVDQVRAVVVTIPAGQVATYGDIGRQLGVGPRQVGRAMSLLGDDIPWWRVTYADGRLATCHDGGAGARLAAEGTPLRGGKVDLARARAELD